MKPFGSKSRLLLSLALTENDTAPLNSSTPEPDIKHSIEIKQESADVVLIKETWTKTK